jgi:hypothetical protein
VKHSELQPDSDPSLSSAISPEFDRSEVCFVVDSEDRYLIEEIRHRKNSGGILLIIVQSAKYCD